MTATTLHPRIQAIVDRGKERAVDPVYIANARRLAAEDAEREALHADLARRQRFIAGRVPLGLWPAIRQPKPTEALAAVEWFLREAPKACVSLMLAGPRGRGKTTALGWAVAERGGLYVEAQTLVRLGTFDPTWNDLGIAQVAAFDELGAEHMNDAYRASLYELLNARYSNARKTIVATNLSADDFRARYCPDPGDRLLERLTKGGKWVNLPGESMRKSWQEG